jgi:hypothetical protein
MRRRVATVLALALGAVALVAPTASASFHLVKIREVGNGGAGVPDYVELQMYASGENFFGSAHAKIQSYNASGAVLGTFEFTSNAASGQNQRTVYVSRDDGTPPIPADFTSPNLIVPNDGAVCYGINFTPGAALDCVAFGAFAGFPAGAPSPVGTAAPTIPSGQALARSIEPGCATLLEPGDDTNDSATDFSVGAMSPRNNSMAPVEMACTGGGGGGGDTDPPETKITKAPHKQITKPKVKIKFSSDEAGSSFMCKLDKKPSKPCESPYKARVKPGKHKFAVYATDQAGNADQSPAKVKFRRVRD